MTNENDCINRQAVKEMLREEWTKYFADKCKECGKILNDKLQESNTPEVNLYEVELMLERLIERDLDDQYVKKPIAHALYLTWKWADENEREREDK